MFDTSYIEISKSAYKKNLEFIRSLIGEDVKFSSVVKGNAYGHGIKTFVPMAEECGVNHFSVFSCEEAVEIKKCCRKRTKILIMGMIANEQLLWAVENDIEFFVFEPDRLIHAIEAAKTVGKKAKIHIEFETGMNRTGFSQDQLKPVLPVIQENKKHLDIVGFCTHYAGAESIANHIRIQSQIRKFNRMCKWMEKNGIKSKMRHTACSAAAIAFPKTHMDMVRIGILQYGLWPSRETLIRCLTKKKMKQDPLHRLVSWKSSVMSTKDVKTGEFIGYGTSFMAGENMKIATVPVGYSYGYSRSLSNIGRVIINGTRESVIGVVNMNVLIIDISDIPETKKGDEVVLIGVQNDIEVTIASFGEMSSQLNYELLTRIPARIPRKIID